MHQAEGTTCSRAQEMKGCGLLQGQKETGTACPQSRKERVTQDETVEVGWNQTRLEE